MNARDHPRIRGEHPSTSGQIGGDAGSSPHTRGAHGDLDRQGRSRRIIPAYAGSTEMAPPMLPWSRGSSPHTRGARRPSARGRRRRTDHPRIRGEHSTSGDALCMKVGSSPHTRGAPWRASACRSGARIIPAYAGSTCLRGVIGPAGRDHPRIRGEHKGFPCLTYPTLGSSPHTRGARPPRESGRHPPRIIPAYAGSTSVACRSRALHEDHPRIRGEHILRASIALAVRGSSPHTRGAHLSAPPLLPACRIIPAYAGSTHADPRPVSSGGDHPRIRGEHSMSFREVGTLVGSSPHTRGAPLASWPWTSGRRIIPAYAGSTGPGPSEGIPMSDHPRIRGEHIRRLSADVYTGGSSPHTRGAPIAVARQRQ